MNNIRIIFFVLLFLSFGKAFAISPDSAKIDYSKLYAYALDADISSALNLLNFSDSMSLTEKDLEFKRLFESRFKYNTDNSNYLDNIKPDLKPLLKFYAEYWHQALKSNASYYDSVFVESIKKFLISKSFLSDKSSGISDDDINNSLVNYIKSLGFLTTGFGKTGKLFDLLIWKSKYDSAYAFIIVDDTINVNVTFMENFATLGWEEYATLGKYYPGGWANDIGLFCVKSAYNLQSEEFLVSYLAHEGRHFKDYKTFPNLSGTELEYRAKLTELMLANNTIYRTIEFFINNSIKDSSNPHSNANYLIIENLSESVFNSDFEYDINKWKNISVKKIHSSSLNLFNQNTNSLKDEYLK